MFVYCVLPAACSLQALIAAAAFIRPASPSWADWRGSAWVSPISKKERKIPYSDWLLVFVNKVQENSWIIFLQADIENLVAKTTILKAKEVKDLWSFCLRTKVKGKTIFDIPSYPVKIKIVESTKIMKPEILVARQNSDSRQFSYLAINFPTGLFQVQLGTQTVSILIFLINWL